MSCRLCGSHPATSAGSFRVDQGCICPAEKPTAVDHQVGINHLSGIYVVFRGSWAKSQLLHPRFQHITLFWPARCGVVTLPSPADKLTNKLVNPPTKAFTGPLVCSKSDTSLRPSPSSCWFWEASRSGRCTRTGQEAPDADDVFALRCVLERKHDPMPTI